MRKTFVTTLCQIAASSPRIVLLTGDLGFSVVEPFAEAFPARFFNVGVAEQDMVGLATGLAADGFVPFVYSITSFAVLRPFEFIRNGPVTHQLPVRIVGVGAGFDYGQNGLTHYGLEDVGVLRTQPGLAIVAPADRRQVAAALQATWSLPGPVYYRIGRTGSEIPELDGWFELDRTRLLRPGTGVAIVALGETASAALAAARIVATSSPIDPAVILVSTLRAAPSAELEQALAPFSRIVTIEAHYVTGGLGSLVAETIAEAGFAARLIRLGVRRLPTGRTGSKEHMDGAHGLTAAAIADAVLAARPGAA